MRKQRRNYSNLDPTLSRGIISIILVVLATIIGLSFFGKAGTFGEIINEWLLSMIFGKMKYAAPVILLIFAWYLLKDIGYDYRPAHGIGAFIFFLALSGLFHIAFPSDEMWARALDGQGGGVFGMFAWALKNYVGNIAGIIILAAMALVSILLIFNTTVVEFVMLRKKFLNGLGIFGKLLAKTTKTLFVPSNSSEDEEDYDEYGDYEKDDDLLAEDAEEERRFSKKQVGEEDDEDAQNVQNGEIDENNYEYPEEKNNEKPRHIKISKPDMKAWDMPAIIRPLPTVSLLKSKKTKPTSGDIKANAQTIKDTLGEFHVDVTMGDVRVGPTVTQYSLKPAKGVKLSRITALNNDLALALAAHPIRIEAPIPGKSLVGIEVPNQKAALVTLKELIQSRAFAGREHNMMIALGKDVSGKVWFADLPKMPHLLIAGATGSGKTVCVNTIIMSLLYQNTAETLRLIMVDPKRVELTLYNGIPHLLTPVITNTSKTINALKWTTSEMERRFELFSRAGNRDIFSYNKRHENNKIPHIMFIVDELADLMATSGNDIEAGVIRLAQMARAVGIHLILATQRPSVDVITGLMKANIPTRIAFSVASIIDSRTILDCPGAEKLIGRGDMLYQTAELSKPVRIQSAFVTEEELKTVVKYLRGDKKPIYDESITERQTGGTVSMFGGPSDDQDPLFLEAKQLILESKKASASLLQRRLKVGYARAARILDELEEAGIIGPVQGAKPREILVTRSDEETSMGMGQEYNMFTDVQDVENVVDDVNDEVGGEEEYNENKYEEEDGDEEYRTNEDEDLSTNDGEEEEFNADEKIDKEWRNEEYSDEDELGDGKSEELDGRNYVDEDEEKNEKE